MKKQEDIELEVVEFDASKEPLPSVSDQDAEPQSVAVVAASENHAVVAKPVVKKKKHKKKKRVIEEKPLSEMTFWEQLREYANSDEDEPMTFNFRAMLGGEGLPRFFRRNWLFITVIVFFTCCYVTSRYMMQTAVLENRSLTDTLLDRRYKALTINSDLLERTLSSHIEENLKDSTIHTPTEQAFPLKTNN